MFELPQKCRILFLLVFSLIASGVAAQTEFTYQGRLLSGGQPATGNHDFEFRLYDSLSGGTLLGTQQRLGVAVVGGDFTVQLDFGSNFPGAARFLEIGVKPAGSPNAFTTLTPRNRITVTPYAIRSLSATSADIATNALQLGGTLARDYVLTSDPRMTDARSPVPGSANYIQNSTTAQASANFNISGSGIVGGTLSAGLINASEYLIGGNRVLGVPGNGNLFAGVNAGVSNTTGSSNSFFGKGAGQTNQTAVFNSFFGYNAGTNNTSSGNSFFGGEAGLSNTTGFRNAFFGYRAGSLTTTAGDNAFFGFGAGEKNTAGANAFFGSNAGNENTTGSQNSYFGYLAGEANQTGSDNAFFGYRAGVINTVSGNSFFGSRAGHVNTTGTRNAIFGHFAGSGNATGHENSFFGYEAGRSNTATANTFVGSQAGMSNTTGSENAFFGRLAGLSNTDGTVNAFFGSSAGQSNQTGFSNAFFGGAAGGNNIGGGSNTFVGAQSGLNNTSGAQNTFVGRFSGSNNVNGNLNTTIGHGADVTAGNLSNATAIGAFARAHASNTIVLGRDAGQDAVHIWGVLRVGLEGEGTLDVCRNPSIRLSSCSSSLRYKNSVETFNGGMEIVRRLRPITFRWNSTGVQDIGFAAEEVAHVEPLLATYNDKGEIEGVKYKQITTVLVNAINEQQARIESQRRQIELMRRALCRLDPAAEFCLGQNRGK